MQALSLTLTLTLTLGKSSPCPVSLGALVGLEAFREADRPAHAALEQYRGKYSK